MVTTPKEVEELRNLFQSKVDAGIPSLPSGPHPNDLERVKDDNWLKKFINHVDGDINTAVTMMIDSMTWRKQFGCNDLTESKLNMDYMKDGLFYPRGKDIDGCTILIFNSKKYIKGQKDMDELRKCIVYWFEKLDKVDKCNQISIFFDMADTGLQNMDMEFTKYLISLFKLYYPDFLNYILIYEMPWILSAAFKVIKTLLPAKAVAKMKFINKSSVGDFVPTEHIQSSWGGKDNYTFTYVPEASAQQTEKKVTFLEPGSPGQEAKTFPQSDGEKSKISINPSDCVLFENDKDGYKGSFTITNNSSGILSYKIKTTSPEKFRVRPSIGVLNSGASQVIMLVVLQGFQNSAAGREKFLVTCTTVDRETMSAKELADLWQDTTKLDVEQHKLRCAYPGKTNGALVSSGVVSDHTDGDTYSKDIDQITKLVTTLKNNQQILDKNLKSLKTIQLFNLLLTALMLCMIIYFFGSLNVSSSSSDSSGEFCSAP